MRSAHSSPGKFPRFKPSPHDCTQLFRLSAARHKKAVFRCGIGGKSKPIPSEISGNRAFREGGTGRIIPTVVQPCDAMKMETAYSARPKRNHAEACAPAASLSAKYIPTGSPYPAARDGRSSSAMQGQGRSSASGGPCCRRGSIRAPDCASSFHRQAPRPHAAYGWAFPRLCPHLS